MNGKQLKILRIQNDLTQLEVQELTGIDRSKLSLIENDKIKLNELRLYQLELLSEAYDYDLLKGEKKMNKTVTINMTDHQLLIAEGYFELGEVVPVAAVNKAFAQEQKELEEEYLKMDNTKTGKGE